MLTIDALCLGSTVPYQSKSYGLALVDMVTCPSLTEKVTLQQDIEMGSSHYFSGLRTWTNPWNVPLKHPCESPRMFNWGGEDWILRRLSC